MERQPLKKLHLCKQQNLKSPVCATSAHLHLQNPTFTRGLKSRNSRAPHLKAECLSSCTSLLELCHKTNIKSLQKQDQSMPWKDRLWGLSENAFSCSLQVTSALPSAAAAELPPECSACLPPEPDFKVTKSFLFHAIPSQLGKR